MIRKLKSFLVILTIALPLMNLYAGDDSTDNNPLAEKRALLFQIGENFKLKSFQGSMISYRKQITSENSYRIGFSLKKRIS